MPRASFPNLTVLTHPLIAHKLSILRDRDTSTRDFKQLVLLTPESRLESERGNLSLSGERGINTSITVDGVDYNNAFFGGAAINAPNARIGITTGETWRMISVAAHG